MPNSLVRYVCCHSHEACVRRDIHAAWVHHSGGWRQRRIESLESLRPMVNTIRKASPKSIIPEHALFDAKKIVIFILGGDTLSKKVMEDLSSAEHKSVVDESSSLVLSILKRECVSAHCQMLSERVRRLSEHALQKRARMQQTCHAQVAVSSIERKSRSSPQLVWERGCAPGAPAGFQRQSRKLYGRPATCGGTVCPRVAK